MHTVQHLNMYTQPIQHNEGHFSSLPNVFRFLVKNECSSGAPDPCLFRFFASNASDVPDLTPLFDGVCIDTDSATSVGACTPNMAFKLVTRFCLPSDALVPDVALFRFVKQIRHFDADLSFRNVHLEQPH